MAYPFEYTVTHRPYEFTFLNVIIVNVTFGGKIQEKYEGFKRFFQEAFKLELSRQRFDEITTKPIQIASDDKVFHWTFFGNTIRVQISGGAYVGYSKTLEPILFVCDNLIEQIGEKCLGVSLQKVNLFPLETNNRDEVLEILDKVVLSDELKNLRPDKTYVDEAKIFLFKNSFSGEGNANHAAVVTGFVMEDTEENSPTRVVLDVSAFEETMDGLSLLDTASRVNNIVDGAFFWSLKAPIIQLMEKGIQ